MYTVQQAGGVTLGSATNAAVIENNTNFESTAGTSSTAGLARDAQVKDQARLESKAGRSSFQPQQGMLTKTGRQKHAADPLCKQQSMQSVQSRRSPATRKVVQLGPNWFQKEEKK